MGLTPTLSRAELAVWNVLRAVGGGYICGVALSAATLAAATLRLTSMPLHTFGRPGASSWRVSSPVRIGSGIIARAKHSTAPNWRHRSRGHRSSRPPDQKNAFPQTGEITSIENEQLCDVIRPPRIRIAHGRKISCIIRWFRNARGL
jgi:hypothetical protein